MADALSMWTVYDHPTDYWRNAGSVLNRMPEDDPNIVEVWL